MVLSLLLPSGQVPYLMGCEIAGQVWRAATGDPHPPTLIPLLSGSDPKGVGINKAEEADFMKWAGQQRRRYYQPPPFDSFAGDPGGWPYWSSLGQGILSLSEAQRQQEESGGGNRVRKQSSAGHRQ